MGYGFFKLALGLEMNTSQLREMFEEDTARGKDPINYQRDSQDMYVSKHTRAMWAGYKVFFERMYRLGDKDLPMVGRYILGAARENGNITMSRSPYRHKTKIGAITEAERLATEHGSAIYLFRCHEVILPKKCEVTA